MSMDSERGLWEGISTPPTHHDRLCNRLATFTTQIVVPHVEIGELVLGML
jgi:hypothetical protein